MTTETSALLYLRAARSSDAAIAEQRRRCTAYADARGWRILDVIADNGVGGMADPPGLMALRERIAIGEAQAVIATDLTRISRDPDRVHAFDRFCRQHGADLCFAEQPINLATLLHLVDRVEDADFEHLHSAHENDQ
ncbi:MAG: recombinase family protein [Armatimonadota bacterium]